MPFQIIHQDITKMNTDAIVNAANTRLLEGGGVCGAIFAAAGRKKLQAECDLKAPCPVGGAVITKGYALKSKYVIHAVGPIWQGGSQNEAKLLAAAYENALKLARDNQCESIAFPLISSGVYGYPKEEALAIAVETIKTFLLENEMMVYLAVFDRRAVALSEQLHKGLKHYIDTYFEEKKERNRLFEEKHASRGIMPKVQKEEMPVMQVKECMPQMDKAESRTFSKLHKACPTDIDKIIEAVEESFSEYLLKLIDEKGLTDVEVYKKANMDRKLFSKIRSQKTYHPKKQTVISLAIALKLDQDETDLLLQKAGYSLSNCYRFDVIIKYFLEQGEYDIFKINEALFYYGEALLGA